MEYFEFHCIKQLRKITAVFGKLGIEIYIKIILILFKPVLNLMNIFLVPTKKEKWENQAMKDGRRMADGAQE